MQSFTIARLKLTLWYLLISYSLLALFTLAVISAERQAFAQVIELVHSHVRGVVFNVYLQQQIEAFEQHFVTWLLLFDAGILLVATVASYFLSGRTLRPIEQMVKAQERFVGDVSHELRTPLASMDMQIQAYKRGNQRLPVARETIDSLSAEVSHLRNVVTGLLRLERLQRDDTGGDLDVVIDVGQLVEERVKALTPAITAKKQSLSLDVANGGTIRAIPDEVGQVVTILLDNAVAYTPVGGDITIALQPSPEVVLLVRNSGPGIDQADLPHVFDRFYRGRNAGDEGVGLGLAIARQLVERQKGSVAVASSPDEGVIFRVVWPSIEPQPSQ